MNVHALPTHIGKYRVKRLLGSGGMGHVYLAEDPDIGREVAIKRVTLGSDSQARERFVREAQTMGRLNHPNIVTLLEYGVDQDMPFLVLELLTGQDLSQWMLRPHRLREQLQVMLDVARAISVAHHAGVLHRDLKPENVRVLDDGRCKLLDFGIAQSGKSQLTAAGYFVGTPECVAPEVMSGSAHTPAADIYSLGLLFYTMLCVDNPFRGDTVQATVARVIQYDPPLLSTRVLGVPDGLVELIHQCLSKVPELRPRSADVVVSGLSRELLQVSPDARVVEAPRSAATAPQPAAPASKTRSTAKLPAAASAAAAPAARTAPTHADAGRWPLIIVILLAVAAGGWWFWPAPAPREAGTAQYLPTGRTKPAKPASTNARPGTEPAAVAAEPDATRGQDAPIEGIGTPPAATLTELQQSPPVTTSSLPADKPAPVPAVARKETAVPAPSVARPRDPEPAPVKIANPEPPAPEPAIVLAEPVLSPAAEPAREPAATRALTTLASVVPPPSLAKVTRVSPGVVKSGRSHTLRIEGSGLDVVSGAVVTSGGTPDVRFRIGKLQHHGDGTLELSVSVARGVPLGTYALLLQGTGVRADPVLFEVSL